MEAQSTGQRESTQRASTRSVAPNASPSASCTETFSSQRPGGSCERDGADGLAVAHLLVLGARVREEPVVAEGVAQRPVQGDGLDGDLHARDERVFLRTGT